MSWVAIEDADTHEVSEFAKATEKQVIYLMSEYRVDKHDATGFQLQDVENGANIVYEGIIYKGGFGYNLWVASKYLEGYSRAGQEIKNPKSWDWDDDRDGNLYDDLYNDWIDDTYQYLYEGCDDDCDDDWDWEWYEDWRKRWL